MPLVQFRARAHMHMMFKQHAAFMFHTLTRMLILWFLCLALGFPSFHPGCCILRHLARRMLWAVATTGLVMGPAPGLVGPGGSWNRGAPVRLSLDGGVNCFMEPPLDEKENALVRSAVGEWSRIIYESDSRSRANEASIEKTAVDNANKQTWSDIIFQTRVTGVVSVACSLLARTYFVNPAITLLQCACFSFVTTVAFFVREKRSMFKALRRGDKIARGDAY